MGFIAQGSKLNDQTLNLEPETLNLMRVLTHKLNPHQPDVFF
jgi:hypothetical protein